MERLAEFSNANVGLGVRDRLNMSYVQVVHGPSRIGLRFEVGSQVPLFETALGRAYIAAADADEVASLVKQARSQRPNDPDEPQRIVGLARSEFSRLGFCSSVGDWHDDIHGIAAPVHAPELGGLLAINVGAPAYLMPKTRMMTEIGPELVNTAREIGEILGHFAPAKTTDTGPASAPSSRGKGRRSKS
ncbi:MAG: IclR family transcriptional regulator [Sphingomonas bacterium]|jgi:DNA-binding IclR family transcriptional regulator|nr:IclR family transcriptional regulator [Sphingomonas bacterium]